MHTHNIQADKLQCNTVNGESFTGLNFRSLSEKHEIISYESFALSINIYSVPSLVSRKYYRENPYPVDTEKVYPSESFPFTV